MFQCPMKCEGEKTYQEQGACPVCGMHLKPIEEAGHVDNDHHHRQVQHEPTSVGDHLCLCGDADCDHRCENNCQCSFYEATIHQPVFSAEASGNQKAYICPMKCEGDKTYPQPGSCPVCGMHLTEVIGFGSQLDPSEDEGYKAYKAMRKLLIISAIFSIPVFVLAMGEMVP